jgi:hypothetical protein
MERACRHNVRMIGGLVRRVDLILIVGETSRALMPPHIRPFMITQRRLANGPRSAKQRHGQPL